MFETIKIVGSRLAVPISIARRQLAARLVGTILRNYIDHAEDRVGSPKHGPRAPDDFDSLHIFKHGNQVLLLIALPDNAVLHMPVDQKQEMIVPIGHEAAASDERPCRLAGGEKSWNAF